MAGLGTAAVLVQHFDEVVLLERDCINAEDQGLDKRGGVPQYCQPHALLTGGLHCIESIFPDFGEELIAAGGRPTDYLKDMLMYTYGKYNKRLAPDDDSPLESISQSRGLLERTFRRRVLSLSKVTLRAGTPAARLRLSDDKSGVISVELRGGEELRCELLVVANGRGSRLPEWLAAEGWPLEGLERQVIDSGLGYASRRYAIPPNWVQEKGWSGASTMTLGTRSAVALPVEDNSWDFIMCGPGGDHPPADEEGFAAYARSLPMPEMYEIVSKAAPLSPIRQYMRTSNERTHYERVALPDGLAVLGDAACCFNPVHGQGMTVGIQGALALGEVLERRLEARPRDRTATTAALAGLAKEFQPKLAKLQDFPWSIATSDDLKFLVAAGKLPPLEQTGLEKFMAWYFSLAVRAAGYSKAVMKEIASVSHMVKPPTAMFAPTVLLPALRIALGDALAALAGKGPRGGDGDSAAPASASG